MKQVTKQIKEAFLAGRTLKLGNTFTDGTVIYLHRNKIVEKREDGIYISNAGWFSNTTKERLNAFASIQQKKGEWYLNGELWDGNWKKI